MYQNEEDFVRRVADNHVSEPDDQLAEQLGKIGANFAQESPGPDITGEKVGRMDGETDSAYATANHVTEIYKLNERSRNDEAMYVSWHWSVGSEDGNSVWGRDPRLTTMENQIVIDDGNLLYFTPDRTIERSSSNVDITLSLSGQHKGVDAGGKASTTFEYVTDQVQPNMSETSTISDKFMLEWEGRSTRTIQMEGLTLFEGESGYQVSANYWDSGTVV